MKKKVGILTLYFNYNYGAVLQAYALNTAITSLGFDCEDIRYYREIDGHSTMHPPLLPRLKSALHLLRHPIAFLWKCNAKLRYGNDLQQRRSKFDSFIKSYIPESPMHYDGHKNISATTGRYDIFVCGSDNIWNMNLLDTTFFLDFVPLSIPKIAYAPGMSVTALTPAQEDLLKPLLLRFSSLSVREASGKKVLDHLLLGEVPQVLDPSLLLTPSDWDKLEKPVETGEPYILCFFIGKADYARKYALSLQQQHHLKIVFLPFMEGLCKEDAGFGDYQFFDIGPGEFIHLIKHATYICTDSFHGTVFSILYEKDFFSFRRFFSSKTSTLNLRIDSLLHALDINGRIIEPSDCINPAFADKIDYQKVGFILSSLRENSISYLKNALDKAKETL